MSFDFVDFINFEEEISEKKEEKKDSYDEKYDTTTTEFYKNMRKRKLNAIMIYDDNFDSEKAFKFPYTWDPYTGERGEEDPNGPLYFNPDELTYYFYKKRLNRLWNEPKYDDAGGFYDQGYYGDFMGSDLMIIGRGGSHIDEYLFRLPIANCYIPKNADKSLITMGPILTNEEIKEIQSLSEKYYKNEYTVAYKKFRPSLIKMKNLYDNAIAKNPILASESGTEDPLITIKILKGLKKGMIKNEIVNRIAVDMLKVM